MLILDTLTLHILSLCFWVGYFPSKTCECPFQTMPSVTVKQNNACIYHSTHVLCWLLHPQWIAQVQPSSSQFSLFCQWGSWYDILRRVQDLTAMGVARHAPLRSDGHTQKKSKESNIMWSDSKIIWMLPIRSGGFGARISREEKQAWDKFCTWWWNNIIFRRYRHSIIGHSLILLLLNMYLIIDIFLLVTFPIFRKENRNLWQRCIAMVNLWISYKAQSKAHHFL